MKGRTNNPAGRRQSPYLVPREEAKAWPEVRVTSMDLLMTDLERHGGDISKLVAAVSRSSAVRNTLFQAVCAEFIKPQNVSYRIRLGQLGKPDGVKEMSFEFSLSGWLKQILKSKRISRKQLKSLLWLMQFYEKQIGAVPAAIMSRICTN